MRATWRLAEQLSISRNTVVRAHDLLLMEGIVEARPASGIFVTEQLLAPSAPANAVTDEQSSTGRKRMPMPSRQGHAPTSVDTNRNRLLFDFYPGRPSAELFPLKTWRRLLQANFSHGGAAGLTQYGEPAGLPALRTAIANHLAAARGIIADPSRIVIVSGVQEALNIAARLFLACGAIGAVEDPCFRSAALTFEAAGARLEPVSVDHDGLIPEKLPPNASLLCLTPSHQYPTRTTVHLRRMLFHL